MEEGLAKGMEKGREEEREKYLKERLDSARLLKENGIPLTVIAESLKLTEEDMRAL